MVRTASSERLEGVAAAVDSSIIDLRNGSGTNSTFLRDEIVAGLKKTKRVMPGTAKEDEKFAHTKTIPTCAFVHPLPASAIVAATELVSGRYEQRK